MISFSERIPPDSNVLIYLPPLLISYNKLAKLQDIFGLWGCNSVLGRIVVVNSEEIY